MKVDRKTLDLFGSSEELEPPIELETPESPPVHVRAEPRVWSVSEVNRSVREMLEDYLPPLWVAGEVANWTAHRSGHRYFTLKDDQAQIRCVMWRSDARRLPIDPENGMNVRVFGGLTLYEARGEYQLTVRQLEARDADGLWRLAFEKLRKKLDVEGLLDPRRKRALPRHPGTVGIVTSATGAALRDMLTVIRRRAPWTRVLVRSCRVQGEGAAVEVAEAIRVLSACGRADVLIVGRGGGSIEDLWTFNEEAVARAIAACSLPVISAVGHEIDVTIADLVADHRAPTPTAAAEAAVPDAVQLGELLETLPIRFARALRGAVERRGRRIADGGGAAGASARAPGGRAAAGAPRGRGKTGRALSARDARAWVRGGARRGRAGAAADRGVPARAPLSVTCDGRPGALRRAGAGAGRAVVSERRREPPKDAPVEEPGLEGRLRRLEQIVSALEADDLELERALALFEEGVAPRAGSRADPGGGRAQGGGAAPGRPHASAAERGRVTAR